ncbi:MAG TPA: 3-keto-5-aminohexanoate cleavage protein [Actinomycetota bacterium]|nr:3-keto-5-aminohexanoate cleavage protein [Actinomycetota bacterium]
MDPLVLTVAAVGAELTLADQPNLPVTPELLARDAAECAAAGASIYHVHVRDEAARPTMDVERFRAARAAVEDVTDLIVQFTTGGAVTDPAEARLAPLDLRPEMATLTTGTVNFGDGVFSNPVPLVTRLYRTMLERDVVPEYEIFDAGMIATAVRLRDELDARHHAHFDFVLGVPGALPAWEDALPFLVAHLPDGATWSATGIGRSHLPVAGQAIALGGHVRTGFEDVLYYEKGRKAESNAQLIERVAGLAKEAGRAVATPAQAREMLGLAPRPAIP